MDILTPQALQELIEKSNGKNISILMPTHPAGKGKEQDPIRFKNLLGKAESQMRERGVEAKQIEKLLQPARALSRDPFFWQHQRSGLALFSAEDMFRSYRLPLAFEEIVTISDNFYLKPILPYFASNGHFFILALSQKRIRLLEGTRYTVEEIDLNKAQPKLAEVLQGDQFFDTVQAHSGRKSPTSGEHLVMFHGHNPADAEKKHILVWLHTIDEHISAFLGDQHAPLVLAGVESIIRLYREACAYPHVTPQSISGNPDEMRPDELHHQAWPIVQPIFMRDQKSARNRYHALSGTAQTVTDVRDILPAAKHGRVDVLFVSAGEKMWGVMDPESYTVHIHRDPELNDKDLLDWTVIETLAHKGDVFVLNPAEMPDNAIVAAIYRY